MMGVDVMTSVYLWRLWVVCFHINFYNEISNKAANFWLLGIDFGWDHHSIVKSRSFTLRGNNKSNECLQVYQKIKEKITSTREDHITSLPLLHVKEHVTDRKSIARSLCRESLSTCSKSAAHSEVSKRNRQIGAPGHQRCCESRSRYLPRGCV